LRKVAEKRKTQEKEIKTTQNRCRDIKMKIAVLKK